MTQEEKSLLLRDLCARLPFNVIVLEDISKEFDGGCIAELVTFTEVKGEKCFLGRHSMTPLTVEEVRPFLRSMSNMTEEEIKTYHSYCECNDEDFTGEILYFDTIESFDYLTSIHIDYRGLIPMNLAIEAPADMYKSI